MHKEGGQQAAKQQRKGQTKTQLNNKKPQEPT